MMTFDIDLEICWTCNCYFCDINSCIFQQEEGRDIFHSLTELLGIQWQSMLTGALAFRLSPH